MGIDSKIEWTDHSWNPWYGCPDDGKRSPACDNCYAIRQMKSHGIKHGVVTRSKTKFFEPVKSKKYKRGNRIFVCSWSDFFHGAVPLEWYADAFDVMARRHDMTWMILTKRPENIRVRENWPDGDAWENLWLGVTVENQEQAEIRIPKLLSIPSAVRFVSVEPMLGPVDLRRYLLSSYDKAAHDPQMTGREDRTDKLDWIISGGESGSKARPMHPDWVRSLRDQCAEAGVPFFFKQWGEHDESGKRVGKKNAGRMLDGREWNEFPERQT